MHRLAALLALPILLMPASGGDASVAATQESGAESERQRQQRDRRAAEARVRYRLADAHIAAVHVERLGALAEMLVPNIRPVPIWHDSRGLPNEVDLAEGVETPADWVAGTRARLSEEQLAIVGRWRGETLGPACNAEFRARFAEHLRRTMEPRALRDAYIFLAPRTPYWRGQPVALQPTAHWAEGRPMISRLVAFDGTSRRPPVRWSAEFETIEREIVRWTKRDRTGRALQRSMDAFWRDHAALLDAPERACPDAAARWPSVQARIVARLESLAARQR